MGSVFSNLRRCVMNQITAFSMKSIPKSISREKDDEMSEVSKYNEYINGILYNNSIFSKYYLYSLNPICTLQNELSSQHRDLCSNDILSVGRIYKYIKDIISNKSIPVNFFEFEKISDVMIRCHKLIIVNDNQHFEIRFNIFLQCAATFIHNHQSNFISLCISGGFVHDFWEINNNKTDKYHKYKRIDADTVQYQGLQSGKIQHIERSVHEKNNIYFLDRDALHTVCTPQSALYDELKCIPSCYDIDRNIRKDIITKDAITFVVRSRIKKKHKTTIVSKNFVHPNSTVNAGGKTDLSYYEKIKIIKLLFDSMK